MFERLREDIQSVFHRDPGAMGRMMGGSTVTRRRAMPLTC